MTGKLDQQRVDSSTYQGPGACYLWDSELIGFGLRIYPSGKKSFVVHYRFGAKQRFFTLGSAAIMNVSQARDLAKAALFRAQCLRKDPAAERQALRHAGRPKTSRIDQKRVESCTYQGSGTCYIWDSELVGFGLRIYPTGNKSFVVHYRVGDKQRFLTLGSAAKMDVAQARGLATATLFRVKYLHDDPAAKRQAQRAPRVSELAEKHLSDHVAIRQKPRSLERARRVWERCVLPKIGHLPVLEVQRAHVAELMVDLASTPCMANKVLGQLSSAFNLAELWGMRPERSNPCRGVRRYAEKTRRRYLSERELGRLGRALQRHETDGGVAPQSIAAIRLLLLTGCRSAEILGLKWSEVDLDRRTLELTDSKTGRRTVYLSSAALKILQSLKSAQESEIYVIPGRIADQPLKSLQRLWEVLRVEADIEDVRIHDLRHTFASFGINGRQSLPVIGKLLGHTKISTTQRYAHLDDSSLREASEEIGADLAEWLAAPKHRR